MIQRSPNKRHVAHSCLRRTVRDLSLLGSLAACVVLLAAPGCGARALDASDVNIELMLEPSPPQVGLADITVKLTDADGTPWQGTNVKVEGNMNHAGMKPSFADLQPIEPGRYTGKLDFTMGGDWFLLVTGRDSQGRILEQKVDVPGVSVK